MSEYAIGSVIQNAILAVNIRRIGAYLCDRENIGAAVVLFFYYTIIVLIN